MRISHHFDGANFSRGINHQYNCDSDCANPSSNVVEGAGAPSGCLGRGYFWFGCQVFGVIQSMGYEGCRIEDLRRFSARANRVDTPSTCERIRGARGAHERGTDPIHIRGGPHVAEERQASVHDRYKW